MTFRITIISSYKMRSVEKFAIWWWLHFVDGMHASANFCSISLTKTQNEHSSAIFCLYDDFGKFFNKSNN